MGQRLDWQDGTYDPNTAGENGWTLTVEHVTEESLICMKPSHRQLEQRVAALRDRLERSDWIVCAEVKRILEGKGSA